MTTLIKNEETLRCFLPNSFTTVKGETSLYDKLLPWLEASEQWFATNITGEQTLAEIANAETNLFSLSAQIIVNDAMINAIPSLDLVLTPNGFGVVSNTNVAPASKERVERLIASLEADRDKNIELLIPLLANQSQWLGSEQGLFFGATLFPNIDIVDKIGNYQGSRWEQYLKLRTQIIDLEASLAEDWFSTEQMAEFRKQVISGQTSTLISQIKVQIIGYLRDGSFNSRRLADIVNHIRLSPEEFPLWHSSETAKLFSPPKFSNKKENNGYWF